MKQHVKHGKFSTTFYRNKTLINYFKYLNPKLLVTILQSCVNLKMEASSIIATEILNYGGSVYCYGN